MKQAHQRLAVHLVGVAETQAPGIHPADVSGRFQQDNRSALARRRDCRAVPARRRAVDNNVGGVGLRAR